MYGIGQALPSLWTGTPCAFLTAVGTSRHTTASRLGNTACDILLPLLSEVDHALMPDTAG
eukprot:1161518-Pelagomonas_calceolata.AAC.9